jgi:hypothetical protein
VDRLSGLDASFLYFESRTSLMHVCGLLVLDPATMPDGYDFERLRGALRQRVERNPAFRRKLIEHHVRHATVAAPAGGSSSPTSAATSRAIRSTATARCGRCG